MEKAGGAIPWSSAVREAPRRRARPEMQCGAVVISAFCLFAVKSSDTR